MYRTPLIEHENLTVAATADLMSSIEPFRCIFCFVELIRSCWMPFIIVFDHFMGKLVRVWLHDGLHRMFVPKMKQLPGKPRKRKMFCCVVKSLVLCDRLACPFCHYHQHQDSTNNYTMYKHQEQHTFAALCKQAASITATKQGIRKIRSRPRLPSQKHLDTERQQPPNLFTPPLQLAPDVQPTKGQKFS